MPNLDINKEVLKKEVKKLQTKEGLFNADKAISKNKLENKRKELIQNLLKRMSDAGVDLGSLESINEFLQKLEQQNPDLREMFEEGFNGLMGSENAGDTSQDTIGVDQNQGGIQPGNINNPLGRMPVAPTQQQQPNIQQPNIQQPNMQQ